MGYLSNILPKCLFPVYDKPIIHHIAENMAKVGVEKIYVIVNYQKQKIMEYFENTEAKLPVEMEFVEQRPLAGIAKAVALARAKISEPFLVILGDDCTITRSLSNLPELFHSKKAVVVEGIVEEKDSRVLRSTCCLQVNGDKQITRIVEKPSRPMSNIRGCGVYVLSPSFFEFIDRTPASARTGNVEITDVIGAVASNGRAYAEYISGSNININSYKDLLEASFLMAKKNSEWNPVILSKASSPPHRR